MIRNTVVSLILLLMSISACASDSEQFQACLALDQDMQFSGHRALMEELGTTCATLYYNLLEEDNLEDPLGWVKREYLDLGYEVILTVIFSKGRDYEDGMRDLPIRIANGEYDYAMSDVADKLNRIGSPVWIRPLHELNGDWRPWQMYYSGNTPETTLAAYEHVAEFFRSHTRLIDGVGVNFNRKDGGPAYKVLGKAELYMPRLARVADAFSISTYNRCGLNDNYPVNRSFAQDFGPAYNRIQEFTDKPINVAETSTSGLCADGFLERDYRIPWFKQMFDDIESDFGSVDTITLFFGNLKPGQSGSEVNMTWKPNADERQRLRKLLPESDMSVSTENQSSSIGFRMPWSVYSRYDELLDETPNTALNPVTGEAFGRDERVLRFTFTQRFLFDVGNGFELGPALWLGTVQSTNDNKWWNNQFSSGISLGLQRDFSRDGLIKWGNWSLDVFAERRQYTVDVPERFSNNNENRYGIRVTVNTGGDWTQ